MSSRVVVLGAAGYLGRHVAEAVRQAGHDVTGVTRTTMERRQTASMIVCDAADTDKMLRVISGADCVINTIAARPGMAVIVADNLCRALRQNAIGRIMQVSSLSVFGQSSGILHEGIRPRPARRHREACAALQAEALIACDDAFAGRVLIVRPGCVYGPGAPIWVDRIARLLRTRRLGWLGSLGEGTCMLIHVEDLSRAMAQTIDRHVSGTYNVVAPDCINWNEYFFRLASLIGALPLRRFGRAGTAMEQSCYGPARLLASTLGGWAADRVTGAMRLIFQNRARIISVRAPLYAAMSFRSLSEGSAQAAEAFVRGEALRPGFRPIPIAIMRMPAS